MCRVKHLPQFVLPSFNRHLHVSSQRLCDNIIHKEANVGPDPKSKDELLHPKLIQEALDSAYTGDAGSHDEEFPSDSEFETLPDYKNYNDWNRDQTKHAYRP